MPNLKDNLNSLPQEERALFLEELFSELATEVNQILAFGPCNKDIVEEASAVYYHNKNNRLFQTRYKNEETEVLPAVIANSLMIDQLNKFSGTTWEQYKENLLCAYLYGTGTCDVFAIVGAYLLAQKYDLELSIEAIFSTETHTYIRLHTQPDYIFDFWSPTHCDYNDTINWNESVDFRHCRHFDDRYRTEITLDQDQLKIMGKEVFTPTNTERREKIHEKIMEQVNQLIEISSLTPKKSDVRCEL